MAHETIGGSDRILELQDHVRLAQACGITGNPSFEEICAHVDRIQNIDEMLVIAKNLDEVQMPKTMSDGVVSDFMRHFLEKLESTHWDDPALDKKLGELFSSVDSIINRGGIEADIDLTKIKIMQILGTADPETAIKDVKDQAEANELELDLAMLKKDSLIDDEEEGKYKEQLAQRKSQLPSE